MTSREKFEAWVKFHLDDKFTEVPLYRGNGGLNYLDSQVDLAWIAWQAAEADMAVQFANAESKCRELAAENAGLKATCDDRRTFIMNGVQLGYIKVPTVESDPALETIRVAVSPQEPTPSTDAFLAELRAQGVEMFAMCIAHRVNYSEVDKSIELDALSFADGLRNPAPELSPEEVVEFAAQLRKGAAL